MPLTALQRQILAAGLLIVALVAGAAVSLARSTDELRLPKPPVFPGAVRLGDASFLTAGIAAAHERIGADSYHVPASVDEVASFYAAEREGWSVERQVSLSGGEHIFYLTQGESIAVAWVMTGAAYLESLPPGEPGATNVEADGAVVTIGLIECLDPGGVETCLSQIAGR